MHISGEDGGVDVEKIMRAIDILKNTESKLLVAFDDLAERYYVLEAENNKLKAQMEELMKKSPKLSEK